MFRFDHVAIPIFDPVASRRFYAEVLGLRLIQALSGDDWGGKPWLMMIYGAPDGRALALCALKGAPRPLPGNDTLHYAFAVQSDAELEQWRQRLRRFEVAFWEEDHDTQRSLYFRDPNDIVFEVTTPPSDTGLPLDEDAPAIIDAYLKRHGA
jgi:catechol 2,3-dioxygenase-like lactoylglutathione lyase family enzyme